MTRNSAQKMASGSAAPAPGRASCRPGPPIEASAATASTPERTIERALTGRVLRSPKHPQPTSGRWPRSSISALNATRKKAVAAIRAPSAAAPSRAPVPWRAAGGAVISNAASTAKNVLGLVFVAAFAPENGETLGGAEANSKDSVLNSALVQRLYPTGKDGETAPEFIVDPAKFHDAFAADVPEKQSAVMAATQRPIAAGAFSEASGPPAWKTIPSWAVVAVGDKAAGTDVIRSMAKRAGARTVEIKGSHVIMVSQPQAVTDVILEALQAVAKPVAGAGARK